MKKCKYRDEHGLCLGQKNTPKCYYNLKEECKKYHPKYNKYNRNMFADLLNWNKQNILYLKCIHKVDNFIVNNIYQVRNVKLDKFKHNILLTIINPTDKKHKTISFFDRNFEVYIL